MAALQTIAERLDPKPKGEPVSVSGGCIHQSYVWGDYFIKTNSADQWPNLHAEAEGLKAIAATKTIRVPEVIQKGRLDDLSYLVLERLDLQSGGDEAALGEHLAALHDITQERYGFSEDNFIGATPQPNPMTDDWVDFFRDQRLGHQLKLLETKGIRFEEADRLLDHLTDILPASPPASVIHGDLWSGNKAFLSDGTPVVFDPSTHFADAECDLAMTELFGGFSRRFYEAYRAHRPAPENVSDLHEIYRLYHILNHAYLFGGGYATQACSIMRRYI